MVAFLLRALGLAYAVGIGLALWYLWPDAQKLIRQWAGGEYRHIAMVVYAFAGLWIAEKVWEFIIPRLGGEGTVH